MKILLTGANGGIGSAIAGALKKNGDTVVEVNRAQTDLSSFEAIGALEKKIASEGTIFDWLVFAHGFIDAETNFEQQTLSNIELTFQLNTFSVIYLTQLFLKHLKLGGGIVFIASTAGIYGNGALPVYSASKAAVNTFAQALARSDSGHTFYSICPGPTETAMWHKIGGESGRAQDPSVVANLAAQLVSKNSPYKSGDVIVVRDEKISVASQLSS